MKVFSCEYVNLCPHEKLAQVVVQFMKSEMDDWMRHNEELPSLESDDSDERFLAEFWDKVQDAANWDKSLIVNVGFEVESEPEDN